MRNWLYSLTPATRGIVLLAGSLAAVAGCIVLWPIAQDDWLFMAILALFVLARIGFSQGAAWLRLARGLDPDVGPEPTRRAAPLGPPGPEPQSSVSPPSRPAAAPTAAQPVTAESVARLRSEQLVLRGWLVRDGILMAALVVGFLLDWWLQGPIGLATAMALAFMAAAGLGIVMLAVAIFGRRMLRRREEELSRVVGSPRAAAAR